MPTCIVSPLIAIVATRFHKSNYLRHHAACEQAFVEHGQAIGDNLLPLFLIFTESCKNGYTPLHSPFFKGGRGDFAKVLILLLNPPKSPFGKGGFLGSHGEHGIILQFFPAQAKYFLSSQENLHFGRQLSRLCSSIMGKKE
jgi:hypothetical protein